MGFPPSCPSKPKKQTNSSSLSAMPALFFSITLLLSIHSLSFSSCSSIDAQGQALLTWKTTLNSSTNPLKSWVSSDQTPCNWVGIHCNSNGDVIKISLKSVDLQGSLPSNLQPLKFLNTLILSSTNLSGPIPKQFGDYNQLVVIDISDNFLSGAIPVEICKLVRLQSLSLNMNYFEGEIPYEIGNLSSLVYFTLYDNKLNGEFPRSIGNLRNLEILRAGGNENLKGELPWEIGNCSNLIMLGLAETGISGNLPSSIGMLKRIQTIAIYTAMLTGPIPEEIGNCTELQKLYLYQNSISGSIPGRIVELRKLQSLLLWQNAIVGSIPYELGSLKELAALDLSDNLLTGTIPTNLGNLSRIQEIQLSVNRLTEHASMQKITEKSDVYSFGVVLLEVLTGKHPLDPTLPGGAPMVQWVRDHLHSKGDPVDILDPKLRGMADPHIHEMLQTLAVSFLCVGTRAHDRPTMKDVAAMLKEIRHVDPVRSESKSLKGGLLDVHASPPARNVVFEGIGSSNSSFAFSDDSI